MDQLEKIQWAFIGLQACALIYFNYYAIQFNNKFSLRRQDLLTVSALIFVELTLLSKLILRTTAIVGIKQLPDYQGDLN